MRIVAIALLLFLTSAKAEQPKAPNVALAQPANAVPADFPKDVPIPADAKPRNALVRPEGGRRLVLELDGRLQDALSFYDRALAGEGWTVSSRKAHGSGAALIATKQSRSVAIGLFDRKGTVQISIEVEGK